MLFRCTKEGIEQPSVGVKCLLQFDDFIFQVLISIKRMLNMGNMMVKGFIEVEQPSKDTEEGVSQVWVVLFAGFL